MTEQTKISGSTAAEIYDSVRTLILNGDLNPGDALPTVRGLAEQLDVNRNTVATAYRRLASTGITVSRGRAGTVIDFREVHMEQEGAAQDSPLTDLASGNPDPDLLPEIANYASAIESRPRLYGEATADSGLMDIAVSKYMSDAPDSAVFTLANGAVDAIERLLAARLAPGDAVVVEDPCFLGSINTLRTSGLRSVGVPVDQEGMIPELLKQALARGAQAVLLTPRAHNPTGASVSDGRAAELREVLAAYPNVMVIEDDHFAMLSCDAYNSVIAEETKRWALVRSVSKAVGPDMRVAFMATDAETAKRLKMRLAPGANWVSHILQDLLTSILGDDATEKLLSGARDIYAERRERLVEALTAVGIEPALPSDGLSLWIPLRAPAAAVASRLARKGWLVRTGDIFAVADDVEAIRVTTSTMDVDTATRFAADLAESVEVEFSIGQRRTLR